MEIESSLEDIRCRIQTSLCMSVFATKVAEFEKKKMERSPKSRSPYKILISSDEESSPDSGRHADKKHTCGGKCKHIESTFSIYVTSEKRLHMCIVGSCSELGSESMHAERLSPERSVYVCEKGWTSHLCDDMCSYVISMKENGGLIPDKGFKCPISGKILMRMNGCSLTDGEKRRFMDEAIQIWRNQLSGGYLPIDPSIHTCDTSSEPAPGAIGHDTNTKLTEEERLFKGISKRKLSVEELAISGGCELVQVLAKVYDSSTGDRHLCMGGSACETARDRNLHWVLVYDVCQLYVCKTTGIPHYCGDACQRKALTKDGLYVCTLTGYVDPNPVARDHLYSGEQRLKSDVDLRRMQTIESSRMSRDDIENVIRGMTVRRAENKKEDYLFLAVSKIASVFSEDQMDAEEALMNESIEKEIQAQMTRYVNKTSQTKRILVAPEMFLLIHNHRKKKDFTIRIHLTEEDRTKLVISYAQKCMQMWYIVVTRTKTGRESPTSFGFKDFVLPALSILQSGFCIPKEVLGYEEVIIAPDQMLDVRCLQNAHRLSRRMESPSDGQMRVKDWTGKKGSQIDGTRYAIEQALMSAICDEGVSPEMLRIDSVSYDAINVDEILGVGKIRTPEGLRKKKRT